jgi:T4 RnlA family RNA ligase
VDNEAFELRGLTFVEQPDGTWERNLLMNKFFNIGQTDGWMEEDVKDKKIVSVANKEDGSIISFVKFPNGEIRAKSKTSFESDQAKMAQRIYDDSENIRNFVNACIKEDKVAIWEIVGPDNQIVLEYQNTELILLQVRRTSNGTYVNNITNSYNIKQAKVFDLDSLKAEEETLGTTSILETLLMYKKISQDNIEGWVVTFEDGQMAKIKTDRYIQLHGLIGPDAFRENLLIQTILDGNIDDVIAQLVPGEKKDRIIAMDEKVVHAYNHLVVEFKELRRKYFQDFGENRKEFAIKYSKEPLFGSVMKTLNTSFRDVEETAELQVRASIDKWTNGLGKAKEWLEKL